MLIELAYILVTLGALGALGLLLNRFYFSGAICKSKNRLDGKVAIITGANTGIGYETALDFAKRGARVIMACRDTKKAEIAAKAIMNAANNAKIEVEYLDLADLDTVRAFAAKMNKTLTRLDLLVNNAGIMMCPYWKTKQGFEMQFGTNHLGHFLLTNLLLDLIKKTGSGRVVNVSSRAHYGFSINWNDLNWEKSYNSVSAYAQSKLANILFTRELAKRLKDCGVLTFSLHPGAVRTELMRYTGEGLFSLFPFLMKLVWPFWTVLTKNAWEGAQTTIHCSVADDLERYNGFYFSDCKPLTPSKRAVSREDAERLWQLSEQLVGLKRE